MGLQTGVILHRYGNSQNFGCGRTNGASSATAHSNVTSAQEPGPFPLAYCLLTHCLTDSSIQDGRSSRTTHGITSVPFPVAVVALGINIEQTKSSIIGIFAQGHHHSYWKASPTT